jgi:large subunit ribosomal protein L10
MGWYKKVRFEETHMPRPEKVQAVADIKERIEGAQAVFLAEYAGLSVKDQQELRRSLRENGAEFKVVKMTMARLAAAELDIDTLDELLLGQTGLAFADGDPAGTAKILKDFAKTHETFVVKGGLLDLEFLPPETIAQLAELEPRDVLLAKIAGVMQAPMANLAGLLAALPRNTANVLSQLLEQKEAEAVSAGNELAEAVAEEPDAESAEEAPADEDVAVSDETAAEADDAPEAEASEEASDVSDDDAETESSEEADEVSGDADEVTEDTAEPDTSSDAPADAEVEADASTDVVVEDDASADAEGADTDDEDETPADAGDEE